MHFAARTDTSGREVLAQMTDLSEIPESGGPLWGGELALEANHCRVHSAEAEVLKERSLDLDVPPPVDRPERVCSGFD